MRRRALTLFATTVLVLSVGAVTTTAPSIAGADVPEIGFCKSDAGLAIGSTGSSVACLQFTLAALGLYHGTLTQKYDKLTAEAMAIFQSNNPPLVDGVATPLAHADGSTPVSTAAAASVPRRCPTGNRFEESASVKCLQDKLKEDGYFNAPSTGAFDNNADAVRVPVRHSTVGYRRRRRSVDARRDGDLGGKTTEQGGGRASGTRRPVAGGASRSPAGTSPETASLLRQPRRLLEANADVIADEFEGQRRRLTQQWAVYIASARAD
jgi:hypothetical protein